jgi:hypothetical protein
MGDNPGRQTDQQQTASVDFNALINAGTNGQGPEAMKKPQDQVRPGAQPAGADTSAGAAAPGNDAVKIGTDATNTVTISNHTLELSFKDPNFDTKLNYAAQNGKDKFEKIKIDDLPPNYTVYTWIDKTGYFFWYDDGTNNARTHHYIPNNAYGLEANNAHIDLDAERLKDNQAFTKEKTGGDFRNFDRNFVPSKDGTTGSTSYYWQLAGAQASDLDIQEHALRESVRNSDNPYFKIYLSDILAAQAMKPLRDASEGGQAASPSNEYTRKKIDDALSVGQAAYDTTKTEMSKFNQFPALNVYLPLAPDRPFWDRTKYPDDYMGFWGGSFSQSYGRTQNLTSLRGLLISNVIPKVRQLPPA